MATVGIRELKEHLSRYIARVKRGERILISDRGKPVALISPAGATEPDDDRMAALIRDGSVSWGGGKPKGLNPPVRLLSGPPISKTILDDRN